MLQVMRVLILAALGAALIGCDGKSGSGKSDDAVILSGRMISVEIESSKGEFVYDPTEEWYHQTSLEETMAMDVMSIEPGKKSYPSVKFVDSMRSTDTDIPNRSQGEYYKLRLVREGDRVLMETRQRFNGEFVKESNFEFKGEIEFVKGDWFGYEAGEPVTVRYTPAGLRASNDALVEQLRIAIEPALRELFLEELKDYKQKEGWKIRDSDLGRILYTETDAEFGQVANTVFRFTKDEASYDETLPTQMRVFMWFGFTTEHLDDG